MRTPNEKAIDTIGIIAAGLLVLMCLIIKYC